MKDSANQLFNDPLWQRASSWLAGEYDTRTNARLGVLGAPLRLGSITPGDCHLAPPAIRDALRRFSTYDVETNLDLHHLAVEDFGDMDLSEALPEAAFAPLSNAVRVALEKLDALVILGGDNSITRPVLHGMISTFGNSFDASSPLLSLSRCALLTLDAHLDLRDTSAGLTNGNPVRALLEDGLPGGNITQIGIQPFANSKAYADVAREAGISVITVDEARRQGFENVVTESLNRLAQLSDAIYVDLDLDVLDRAFAPATPGSRPGGLTPAEIRRAAYICGRHERVRVMDLVEMDASKDINDATALAAAACLLSFATGLMSRPYATAETRTK